MAQFTVETSEVDGVEGVIVVTMQGEMDTDALPAVEAAVNPLVESDLVKVIVYDMTGLGYMNSRSVGLLMNTYGILKDKGRQLVLTGIQEGVKDTLSLVGVTQLVPVFETVGEYVASVNQAAPAEGAAPEGTEAA